jgi:tetratricopeptide (TPR) repeat protein
VYRLPFGEAMAQAIEASAAIGDLELLGDRGLLLRQGEGFTLHPLVAELVRSRVTEEARVAGHEGAIDYYSANFQKWDGTIESCRAELESFYHACELGQYQRADGMLDRCEDMLDRAGQWRSLLPLYERLTNEWQATDDAEAKNLGWAWTRLGNLRYRLGDAELAATDHHQAKEIFDQLDFQEGKMAVFGHLGNAYEALGKYEKAIEYQLQSLEIATEIDDQEGKIAALCNLGNAHSSLAQYKCKQNIETLCFEEYKQAIIFYEIALPLARAAKNLDYEANCICGLGDAYNFLGDYKSALVFHQQDNVIACETGRNPENEARSRFNMALSHYNLGNPTQALSDLQGAKTIYQELQLDYMIERCDNAIKLCKQAIAKSQRNLRLQSFLLCFCIGLAIALLIYWLKR